LEQNNEKNTKFKYSKHSICKIFPLYFRVETMFWIWRETAMRNVVFTLAEEELIEQLMEMFKIGRIQAVEEMITYKRDQALYYEKIGQTEIAKMLKEQLGET